MSEIDIRATEKNVHIIRFSSSTKENRAVKLIQLSSNSVVIQTPSCNITKALLIDSKEDAENMIKALQHALYLGWFNDN